MIQIRRIVATATIVLMGGIQAHYVAERSSTIGTDKAMDGVWRNFPTTRFSPLSHCGMRLSASRVRISLVVPLLSTSGDWD